MSGSIGSASYFEQSDLLGLAQAAQTAAAASATAAGTSATQAATSASAAGTSATQAATSATGAASSATAAAASATTAATAAITAANTAVPAGTGFLIGAGSTAGRGVLIQLGANLSLSGNTLNAAGGGGGSGTTYSADGTSIFLSGTTFSLGAVALSKIAQGGAATNQVLSWNGTAWVPATVSGGGGSGTVNTGTTGTLAFYAANGTTLSPLTIGTNLSISGTTLNAAAGSGGAVAPVTVNGTTIPASVSSPYVMQPGDYVVNVTSTAAAYITLPTAPTIGVTYKVLSPITGVTANPTTVSAPSGATINGGASFIQNADADAISYLALSSTAWRIV